MTTAVGQFGGIGWGFACRELGIDETGIDIEPTVELTRKSLGWDAVCADILDVDPADYAGVDGLISSPPCQSWSRAGKGLGLDDPRGELVWQPLVWALAIRPRWVVCEQVPEARGAFELIAHRLREVGYHATTYTISAETLGVPQTRLRVFLAAHYDRPVDRPALTHQRYRKGRPRVEPADMLGHLPWVSMAEALGVGFLDRPGLTVRGASESGGGHGMDGGSGARQTIAEAFAEGRWQLHAKDQANAGRRYMTEPAPTLLTRSINAAFWPAERPSTTVCADPRVGSPMHHTGSQNAGAVPVEEAGADKPVALTEAQGCALMGFPPGTAEHLQGNKAERWRIIGNAVCPPVAAAVLRTVTPS